VDDIDLYLGVFSTVAGLLFAGGAWLYKRFTGRRPAQRATIAAAPDGRFVCVVGKVVGIGDLQAPVTGRPCAAYDVAVREGPDRQLVARRMLGAPFLVDDGTGKAVVDPRGAYLQLDMSLVGEGTPDRLRPLHDPTVLPRGSDWFFLDEGLVQVGDRVVVMAMARHRLDVDGAELYRALDTPPGTIALVGSPDRAAVVSNLPIGDVREPPPEPR
jgi:hypothetical protein